MIKIFRFFKPYKGKLILMFVLMALGTLSELFTPTIMSNIINNGINEQDLPYIITQGIYMIALALIGLIVLQISIKLRSEVMSKFNSDLRNQSFAKVNSFSYQQFNKYGAGGLITRTTEDTWVIRESFQQLTSVVVSFPIFLIGGSILAFLKDPIMSLIMLVFAPIILFVVIKIGKNLIPRWENSELYIDKQNNLMRERLSGIRVIRAFNSEEKEHDKLKTATQVMADNIIKANITSGIISPFSMLMLNLATVLILFIGSISISNGTSLLSGDLVAILQYIILMLNSIVMASFGIIFMPRIKVTCRRLNELFDTPCQADEEGVLDFNQPLLDSNGNEITTGKGKIVFDNVTFTYEGASQPVLQNVNLDIPSGSTVAFIGGTGSGKSTIIQLLLGFYSATQGTIFIDDKDISQYNRASVRSNIAVSQQKSSVFMGTLKENLLIGNPNADDKLIETVCDVAQLNEFVSKLEKGIDYVVDQGGTNLSGGQKQRINIARAIIKDCPIYVFDDSFSALDFLTESKLRTKLNKFLKNKTQLIITQRISTAMSADLIYVLDCGNIIGSGTHTQLLKDCEVYKQIYTSQIGASL